MTKFVKLKNGTYTNIDKIKATITELLESVILDEKD